MTEVGKIKIRNGMTAKKRENLIKGEVQINGVLWEIIKNKYSYC